MSYSYQKDYQTFDQFSPGRFARPYFGNMDIDTSSHDGFADKMFCCGKGCFIFIVLFVLACNYTFNGIAITYANDYSNSTCYQSATLITMSNYVLASASCSIAIFTIFVIIIIGVMIVSGSNVNPVSLLLSFSPVLIIFVLYSMFSLGMAIVGAIELTYSYPSCSVNSLPICIFTIIMTILHFGGIMSCCCSCCKCTVNT